MEKVFSRWYFTRGVLAGVCIGIAATIYLKLGGVVGAVLFAFGLIAVVSLQLNLFTGKAQFVWGKQGESYGWLGLMLLCNIVGCALVMAAVNTDALQQTAESIISTRLAQGTVKCGFLSIGCGLIMSTAVQGVAKNNNWWPLLFGVPAFIICGFPHCVADAFYLTCCSAGFLISNSVALATFYVAIVIGNYFGCNLYRLIK
ncbi:MAG: formate/nitrite transporter family protein [Candidatus Amulumruptor caecigallinarius]|nr:formate/nitrite transporter family protein [Candidatus Amulumruptor caecigallinarius]MCM1397607.1 formate/nitrite transporter family protein [Candidatus Amulumruptor caecigallinarius]MCM1454610.1 formate/nitrite transporter family protein [bacterium]